MVIKISLVYYNCPWIAFDYIVYTIPIFALSQVIVCAFILSHLGYGSCSHICLGILSAVPRTANTPMLGTGLIRIPHPCYL